MGQMAVFDPATCGRMPLVVLERCGIGMYPVGQKLIQELRLPAVVT